MKYENILIILDLSKLIPFHLLLTLLLQLIQSNLFSLFILQLIIILIIMFHLILTLMFQ